ncbi:MULTISPECIES: universal stress protein [unclassified Pseudonocardia]|jgi:nucleotide-binding universal stress UspA family protein|uniref:universal stress protein n=1 Tax=unclassified Pseudonocardia TaxID=2619320 RepID=UPI0009614D73|nr:MULTISPECIES: universal stress protein [unclassified Pseudonocardia]MBN9101042.1 universal stress protein [Pseudonocardia sp.]OJY53969.1 MAG: hypothetical protein BGP03_19630 [Pseudonocardia sp. 73-21]
MVAGGTVMVGVDGSAGSEVALRYAVEEAARRGARLTVVTVARFPDYSATPIGLSPTAIADVVDAARGRARTLVDEAMADRAVRVAAAAPVEVTIDALAGVPVEVLLGCAAGADLLVLGHRGLGAVRSAVLGSVGLGCVLHAPCPVTIVPATATAPRVEPAATRG